MASVSDEIAEDLPANQNSLDEDESFEKELEKRLQQVIFKIKPTFVILSTNVILFLYIRHVKLAARGPHASPLLFFCGPQ
jgi:hypothetical protein